MAETIPMPINCKLKFRSIPSVKGRKPVLRVDGFIALPGGFGQKVSTHDVKIAAPSTPVLGPRIDFGPYFIDGEENSRLGNPYREPNGSGARSAHGPVVPCRYRFAGRLMAQRQQRPLGRENKILQ